MSNSVQPHRRQPTRLLCPWDSPGKSTRVGCHCLLPRKLSATELILFELLCWRRLLRVPWTARRSNQSILKEINPEYSFIGPMLKLKLQYFGYPMQTVTHWKRPRCWERLRTRGEDGGRGWDGWMASLTQWTWTWANSRRWWGTVRPGMLQSMGPQRAGRDLVTE